MAVDALVGSALFFLVLFFDFLDSTLFSLRLGRDTLCLSCVSIPLARPSSQLQPKVLLRTSTTCELDSVLGLPFELDNSYDLLTSSFRRFERPGKPLLVATS